MSNERFVRPIGIAIALCAALAAGGLAPAHADEPLPDVATPAPEPTPEPTPAEPLTPADEPLPDGAPAPTTGGESTPDAVPPVLAAELPPGPTAPAPAPDPIDAYSPYRPQSTCDPTAKPGTTYLLNLLVSHYGGRRSSTSRACDVGGTSEHKEGRALDWGVNVANPTEKAAGDSFVNWLTAVGPDGKVGYNARRLGVMYVIWNGQIWTNSSAAAAWRPYTGSNPHTDHVHVSLSWNGAYQLNSWWTGVAAASELSISRYVTRVYQDLFGRAADADGLSYWTSALNRGTPRIAVANSITSSPEYRSGLITGVYRDFLGRDPEPSGLAYWLGAMAAGMTIQSMEAGFLGAPEYYAQAGGTDAGWVTRLYQHVLSREPAAWEVQGWVDVLASGQNRTQVAVGFVLSTERLGTVVNGYYRAFLGREIDPGGLVTWVGAIQRGTRTEAIIGSIIASEEYFARVSAGT